MDGSLVLLIIQIMGVTALLTSLLIVQQALCLAARAEHQLTTAPSHQWFYAGQIFQTFQLLGILVVIIGVGVCCFYCRGFFSGNRTETVVVQPESRQQNRVAAAPPRNYEPIDYEPVRAEPKNNAVLEYFSSQKPAITKQLPPQREIQAVGPYVTKNSGPKHQASGWGTFSSTITSCAACNLFNKGNEIPMVQVECLEDHCFHIQCLSQLRSKAILEMGGNGLNRCPKCKETYSPVVKIFCPACKRMAITLNLIEFSSADTGQIQTQRIINKYGRNCHNCG